MKGVKFDKDKAQWWLLPWKPIIAIVEILQLGAEKYAAYNWQNVKDFKNRYYSALMRHLTAWWDGETMDPESGKHHLAHVGCNVIFLLWYELGGKK